MTTKNHLIILSIILLLNGGATLPMESKAPQDKEPSSAVSSFAGWINSKAFWTLGGAAVGGIIAYIAKRWYKEDQSRSPFASSEINLTGQPPSNNS